jgi:uncharacterized protein YkwD
MTSRTATSFSPITPRSVLALAIALVLNGCGGGGSGAAPGSTGSSGATTVAAAQSSTVEFQAQTTDLSPKGAGITACIDPADSSEFSQSTGFIYNAGTQTQMLEALLNHARCLAGVPSLARHQALDTAASNHANYSVLNASATHTESSTLAGFTASSPGERMSSSGYSSFSAQRPEPYQWGEVLARTGPVAREAHDGLISAIYHRLAMLSPQVAHAGVALHTTADAKEMVSVIDMAASTDLRKGGLIAYPAAGQQQVPVAFNSDLELPDPFPAQGIVGYPISIQSDRGSVLRVNKFELRDANQQLVASHLRAKIANAAAGVQIDPQLDSSEAFLSAAAALTPNTTYTVTFEGSLDGNPVIKTWAFSTESAKTLASAENNALNLNDFTRVRIEGCSGAYSWRFTNGLQVSMFSTSWMQVRALSKGMQWIEISDTCGNKQRIDFQVS